MMRRFLSLHLKSILILAMIMIIIMPFFTLVGRVYALDTPTITEFPSRGGLWDITSGSDGNLWFTPNDNSNMIGRISPEGTTTDFLLPTYGSYPLGITAGPDGNIWFTESSDNKIGKITPEGTITEFQIPSTKYKNPLYITTGSDGNIWFTEYVGNKIGRLTLDGIFTEFAVPTSNSGPAGITNGPDGNIWFTEFYGNKIGRISTNGIIAEFPIPTINSRPYSITSGSDGNLWFTESSGNKIGRITPEGTVTEFSIPTNDSYPNIITAGPDDNLWFTEYLGNKIARITPEGTITEFSVPSSPSGNSSPAGITAGPDGNIWFTENSNLKIGRVNLVPSDTENGLSVPYFSQNTLPWGPSEYDHSQSLGFSNITMDRWGCAVTSAAMVLNYHNMNEFEDGTQINPGTLNDWLKTHNGYLTGGSGNEPYSYLSWPAISKLTKDLFNTGKSNIKLMHKRAYPSVNTATLLNDDLNIRKFPDILYVNNASTSGHFVVAKGILGNTYSINDPEWNVSSLSSFNNSYTQVDRYVPSNTNLSYIVLVVNSGVEILVTDSLGRRAGKYMHDGQIEEFNQIPDATYGVQDPISNDFEDLGTGVNEFLLPEPSDGNYTIILSSSENENYTLNLSSFESDGNNMVHTFEGTVSYNIDDTLNLNYSQTQASDVDRIVTFQSTINDINDTLNLNLLDSDHLTNHLIRLINQAQEQQEKGNTDLILKKLDQFIELLQREQKKGITQIAYQILFYDADFLIKEYSN